MKIIQSHVNSDPPFTFDGVGKQQVYSENIKIYQNRKLLDCLMIINEGAIYLIQKDKLLLQPFSFLSDIVKVRFSETFESYIALKIKDLKKFQCRDHVILDLKDRRLLADFMLDYAQQKEDDVIWENNEEFNMIVLSSPVWFSFEDLEKCKKEALQLFKSN